MARFFEDLEIGEQLKTNTLTITKENIISFATQWDPQPMHIDETAAEKSFFGTLVGSGWHTLCATMHLIVTHKPLGDTPLIGRHVKDIQLYAPLLPETAIYVTSEVLSKRLSSKTTSYGYAEIRIKTCTDDDNLLAEQVWTIVIPTKESQTI